MAMQSGGVLRQRLFESYDKPARRLFVTPLLDPEKQVKEGEASIDLRLGVRFTVRRRGKLSEIDTNDPQVDVRFASAQHTYYVPIGSSFVLHPDYFVLAETLEYLRLPEDLAGYVVTRSSWGRHGLVIATAIGVHPGYCGVLTLELRNLADVPLRLYPGRRILQFFLHDVIRLPGEKRKSPSTYEGGTRLSSGILAPEQDEMQAISRFANWDKYPPKSLPQ